MRLRSALVAAVFAVACTTHGPGSNTPAGSTVSSSNPTPGTTNPRPPSAAPSASSPPGDPDALPAADRVFFAGGHVLGADGTSLWARTPGARGRALWRADGDGVVHAVTHGDLGDGPRYYVARGVGRGHLQAPLVLESLDPATGARTELWRTHGERNEPVTLAIADVDANGKPELAFSYYASKYMVRTRHLGAGGVPRPEGPEVRMATLRLWADVDGDGRVDEVLGRVYGDAKDVPGDLRVDRGRGLEPVPVENGLKSAVYTAFGASTPALYFCDGWVANYGKAAKARLKRARFGGGVPTVELLGESPDEFTFFALTAIDVDGDGRLEVVAQGDKRITIFSEGSGGAVTSRRGPDLEPVLNTAVGPDEAGRAVVYVPARPNSRVLPLAASR